jgi:hypothetical protein
MAVPIPAIYAVVQMKTVCLSNRPKVQAQIIEIQPSQQS